jgi:hypothetical protein
VCVVLVLVLASMNPADCELCTSKGHRQRQRRRCRALTGALRVG